jgi:pilus assembly protein Flp/PilA
MSRRLNGLKKSLGKEDEGATMVEYGIMIGLIALVCFVAVTTLGDQVQTWFTDMTDAINPD